MIIINNEEDFYSAIYHTRWEHRALYNNTTHTHTHACTHTHTHTHTDFLVQDILTRANKQNAYGPCVFQH